MLTSNVHNVLEAAVYGIPVVFGPKHTNSQEAVELARRKGAFVVTDQQSLNAILQRLLADSQFRKQTGAVCRQLVKENAGATERILRHLRKKIGM
jgi:3-deoxy-D-manno-octulosonic-acid transferase